LKNFPMQNSYCDHRNFDSINQPQDWRNNVNYYMAFQNSLFWLVDKRSVKTHIRTVVRIFRIWTGVPDVVYLAGNFCFANYRKNFCFLIFQLCVIKIYR
jgi:hypothetical protein